MQVQASFHLFLICPAQSGATHSRTLPHSAERNGKGRCTHSWQKWKFNYWPVEKLATRRARTRVCTRTACKRFCLHSVLMYVAQSKWCFLMLCVGVTDAARGGKNEKDIKAKHRAEKKQE